MIRYGLVLCIPLLAAPALARDEVRLRPAESELPVAVKRVEPIHALVLPMAGGFEQHAQAFARLSKALERHAIQPTGPAFGRYFNGAAGGATPLWQVGLPVPEGTPLPASFELVDLPSHLVASLVHEGPYEEAAKQWPLLIGWAIAYHYRIAGAPTQVYFGEAGGEGADAPRTELQLPIEKAE